MIGQTLITILLLVSALANENQVPGLGCSVKKCCDALTSETPSWVSPKYLGFVSVFHGSTPDHIPSIAISRLRRLDTGGTSPSCTLIDMFHDAENGVCRDEEKGKLPLQKVLQASGNKLLQAGTPFLGLFLEQGECDHIHLSDSGGDTSCWDTRPSKYYSNFVHWGHGPSPLKDSPWTPKGKAPAWMSMQDDKPGHGENPGLDITWGCEEDGSGWSLSSTWGEDNGGGAERISSGDDGGELGIGWECYKIKPPTTVKDEWHDDTKQLVKNPQRVLVYFYGARPECPKPKPDESQDKAGNSLGVAGKLGIALLVIGMLASVVFFAWSRTPKKPRALTGGLMS